MKLTISIFLCFVSFQIQAQNNVLDYLVTETNDTIYGVIKADKLYKIKKDSTLTYSISKANIIRKNDIIYKLKTEGFKTDKNLITKEYKQFISVSQKQQDYIVNKESDTVFGEIKDPFFGAKFIKNNSGNKTKICKEQTLTYRKNNVIYDLKHITKPILSVDKDVFLKRLYKGEASLYEYKVLRNDAGSINPKTFYIIEKENQLHLISNIDYKQQLVDLFLNPIILGWKIETDFYSIENLYLILKYYDLS
ncbi:hypothetical protein [Aurantibacter sp.]|uniref:hypothetical protein n=1 Tax=Aurantibacter sp. TaxID=2807103 RepID=UPI0035C7A611